MKINIHQGFLKRATIFKGAKRASLEGHNLKLKLDILQLMMKSKKKVLGVLEGNIAFLTTSKGALYKKKFEEP